MTGRADGQVVNEWPDYDQQRKAAERSVIDTLRTLHPDEREQVITAAQDEFYPPPPVQWSGLIWGAIWAALMAWIISGPAGSHLTEFSRGFLLAVGAGIVCAELWEFVEKLWWRRCWNLTHRGDAE